MTRTSLPARRTALLFVTALATGCASTGGLAPQARLLEADALQASRSLTDAGSAASADMAETSTETKASPSANTFSKADFPRHDWWTALGDRQLDALISEALRGTPSLQAADARIRQAQAQAGLTDVARKPDLSASAQVSSVQLPSTLAPPPVGGELSTSGVLMFDFAWAPDLWGGKRAQYEAAVGQLRATEVDAQAARLMLASSIARTYVALAQAHEALDVAEHEARRNDSMLKLGRQRVDAGLDNQMSLRQAESGIAAARQQAQAAQHQIDTLRNALAALLGQGPDRGRDITRPQLLAAAAPALPSVLPSELLGHRPDVVAARWRVEAASRGIDATKASFKPGINLSAIVGLAAPGLAELFSSDAQLGFGGPALSLPIFDGEHLRTNLAKSNADYDLAVANYNQSLVTALHDVVDAVQAARSLQAQIISATQARDAASSAHALATARYKAGLCTQLDVLAAQRPLLELDQVLAGLRAQRYLAAIDLDRALGGGLNPAAPDTATSTAATSAASTSTAPTSNAAAPAAPTATTSP